MKQVKIIVEKHSDGYVAYPLGIQGAVGNTYEEALADVKSAIRCYIEIFGSQMLEEDSPVIEVFVAETVTPLVMPNQSQIKSGTLRAI